MRYNNKGITILELAIGILITIFFQVKSYIKVRNTNIGNNEILYIIFNTSDISNYWLDYKLHCGENDFSTKKAGYFSWLNYMGTDSEKEI